MQTRILRSLGCLVFLGLIDIALGHALMGVLTQTKAGAQILPVAKVRAVQPKVVILGNSRAKGHYMTETFEQALGLSVLNAGNEGQTLSYIFVMVELILQHYQPELVLIEADPRLLTAPAGMHGAITRVAPYLNQSPVFQSILREAGPLWRIRYLSQAARFNAVAPDLFGWLIDGTHSSVGFDPIDGRITEEQSLERFYKEPGWDSEVNPQLVKLMEDTIDKLLQRGVSVFLACSPRWRPDSKLPPAHAAAIEAYRRLALAKGVNFQAMRQESVKYFRNPELFADPEHLNYRGARIFSRLLADKLVEIGLSTRSRR